MVKPLMMANRPARKEEERDSQPGQPFVNLVDSTAPTD
jgi:hypothetical protein